jgi:HEAT repeat protein
MKRNILVETLSGADPLVAAEAARLIGDWNRREHVSALIEYARFNCFYSKVSSFYALARLSAKEAVPYLTELVVEPNVSNDWYWYAAKGVRAGAAVSLLKLGSDAGVGYLRELAEKRDNVFIRWFAPELLRLDAPKELIAYLTVDNICTEDRYKSYDGPEYSQPGMLTMLCEALGLIDDPKAESRLEFYFGHYSRFVRGQAYRSLHKRRPGKETAQKIVVNAKKHGTDFDRLVAAEIQGDGATLAAIAGTAAAGFDRGSAIDALAAIKSPALLDAGKLALKDVELYVRQCAVEALARQHPAEAKALFTDALKNEKEVRVLCALAATDFEGDGK